MKRILVCGGREYANKARVREDMVARAKKAGIPVREIEE